MPFSKSFCVLVVAFACTSFATAQTSTVAPPAVKASAAMTNDDVIALAGAGLGDEIVIAKINAGSNPAFDTSLAGLKSLKAAGVSIEVVKAMISPGGARAAAVAESLPDPEDFNQIQPTGVYALLHEGSKPGHLTKLAYAAPSSVTQAAGFPAKIKATLSGQKASVEFSDVNPVFYVYPKTDDATSQREINSFELVKFTVDKKGRQLVLGTIMNAKENIDEKSKREIKIVQVKSGIYKVTLVSPLEPGEYALYEGGTWRPQIGPVDGGSYFEFGIQ